MSLLRGVQTGSASFTATTAKTAVQLVPPANQRIIVRNFVCTATASSATEAMARIRVLKQTTAGTSSAGTPVKGYSFSETLQTATRVSVTVEPTASDVLYDGTFNVWSGFLLPKPVVVAGGERLGFEITAGSGSNPTIYFSVEWEE